ncbi:MAG TPA: asparagine synthase (glutamine-hydrolyzing), partial [Terriglobia bacterium]|nr:asparagine synthase (glutamine-hydrolyzing) [Terriglobia bacterium]
MTENSAGTLQGYEGYEGPGEAKDIQHRIGIGHRRFSIVDTSSAGHQPFWSSDSRVCVAFNGEIYNYVELREELKQKGFRFHTASDTEVLAMAYRAWGVKCFQRFNGFWAVSLYDQERRQILLARDRIGKAPLYVTRDDCGLYWASEIKGLFAMLSSSQFIVHEQAVIDFVTWYRRDLFHETFYNGIRSFPNAAYAWVEADGSYHPVTYWDVPNRRLSLNDISVHEAKDRLKQLLGDAVRLRLRADVPVSVQLSGGMDSSSLLALAANSAQRVHVYTVAFPESEANEESFARKVAEHYNGRVDYSVIEPPPDDILDHADSYIHLMGEPFHSPNQFTSHRIWTAMTKQGFRATLYGAGGDEVFAGYSSDYFLPYLHYLLKQGRSLRFLKEFFLLSEHRPGRLGFDYLRMACRLLPGAPRLYHSLVKDGIPPGCDPFVMPKDVSAHAGPSDDLHGRLIDDMTHWRMNYWLRIDNQNSMGVPLELRLPFLDYRVVEFGFTLPMEFLIRDGWMKWLLRSAVEDLLPRDVVWRKRKMGFPFPLKPWLGHFKGRILSMLQPLDSPYLDMKKFNTGYEAMREHDPTYLWCLISLAMWWKR